MTRSIQLAEEMLRCKSVVFFEVEIDTDEEIFDIAKEISALGCSVIIDQPRNVVKCFCPDGMPKGFGFL